MFSKQVSPCVACYFIGRREKVSNTRMSGWIKHSISGLTIGPRSHPEATDLRIAKHECHNHFFTA